MADFSSAISKNFSHEKTAIIAGNGLLPCLLAQNIQAKGQEPFIVPLRGEAAEELYAYDHEEISVVEFSKLIKILKAQNIQNVVLAGGIKVRPQYKDIAFDYLTLKALPRLLYALRQGDDALLRSFITIVEGHGFKVIAAQDLMPNLLAPAYKKITKAKMDFQDKVNFIAAAKATKLLGKLDVGQAAVAVGGRVVAVEGAEGTDNMLLRIKQLRAESRIPQKGGVLVKSSKPQQELRADLPTIGEKTIEIAHESGLSGIAIEANKSFILDFDKTVNLADSYNMFLTTFCIEDLV